MDVNTKTTRIADELSWVALRYRFYSVDLLEKAINDGTLMGMIEANANEMYNGDIREVIVALRKNLSSKGTNLRKAKTIPVEARDDAKRLELLWAFTGTLAAATKPVTESTLPITDKSKARWQLTMEEIDSIPKDDYKSLDSVYQNMMSKKAKKPEQITDMDDFMNRLAHVSVLRSTAKEKVDGKKVVVSDAILTKLTKGGKTVLSTAEVEELLKALKK